MAGARSTPPWLFVTEEGTPLDESRVRKAFAAILKDAGLPARFTPHSLRHTYASLMLTKGAPLAWVAAQLGHSSPQVTLAKTAGERLVTSGDQNLPRRRKRSVQVTERTGAGARD